jgi:hypothetical protein
MRDLLVTRRQGARAGKAHVVGASKMLLNLQSGIGRGWPIESNSTRLQYVSTKLQRRNSAREPDAVVHQATIGPLCVTECRIEVVG